MNKKLIISIIIGLFLPLLVSATVFDVWQGGTGTSDVPSEGELLVGTSGGVYTASTTISGDLTITATTTLQSDLLLGDNQRLYFDTAKNDYITYNTTHGMLELAGTYPGFASEGDMGFYAGGTEYNPSLTLWARGDVTLGTASTGEYRYVRINAPDGLRLNTSNYKAIIRADNFSSDKTFQFPNLSGTFLMATGTQDIETTGYITATGFTGTASSSQNLSITSQATGSLAYYSGEVSDAWANLAIGTDDYVLTASSTVVEGMAWMEAAAGNGATTFLELTDVPASYSGESLKYVRVNTGETALEFTTPAAGASTALDNLASVAINTSLISDTDSTDGLGSLSKAWANLYVDTIQSVSGNDLAIMIPSTKNFVINTDQFVIEKDTGNIGIGTVTPVSPHAISIPGVHLVVGEGSGATPDNQRNIILDSDTQTGITFLTPNNQSAYIEFGDPQDNNVGWFRYTHSSNLLSFRAGGFNSFNAASTGIRAETDSTRDSGSSSLFWDETFTDELILQQGTMGVTAADQVRLAGLDLTAGDSGLHIKTENDTEHLFASRVGLATTTPEAMLEVAGGILPAKLVADPCGAGYPSGTFFYNLTGGYPCYCDNSGDDLKFSDNSACF